MSRKHILEPLSSVAKGENPNGFVSQTVNETVREGNSEIDSERYRYNQQADGERWNGPIYPAQSVPIQDTTAKKRRADK